MKTIITVALLVCFTSFAHAGQQLTNSQLLTLMRAQQLAQSNTQLENLRAAQQQSLALQRIQRQQRLQQWQQSFYDLSMLIEASRTRRAIEGLARQDYNAAGSVSALPTPRSPVAPVKLRSCDSFGSFSEAFEAAKAHLCQGAVPSPSFWK